MQSELAPATVIVLASLGGVPPQVAAQELYFDRAPFLQQLTTRSVLVVSQSASPLRASIRYGIPGDQQTRLVDEVSAHDHVFRLDNLEADTVYDYEVDHAGETKWSAQFRTLPPPGASVRIAALGDSGHRAPPGNGADQDAVAEILRTVDPQLLLHTGDLAYPAGHPVSYQHNFFDVYGDVLASIAVFPVLGNHDGAFSNAQFFEDMLRLPRSDFDGNGNELNYSFDAGDAHLVALNSVARELTPQVREWLQRDLISTTRTWKIVYFHHPPYSVGTHGGEEWVKREIVPILEGAKVDLVLSGHEHLYERSYPLRDHRVRDVYLEPRYVRPEGIVYVVTGGGGAALSEKNADGADQPLFVAAHAVHHLVTLTVDAQTLLVEAIDRDGQTIDRFEIVKSDERRPPFSFVAGDANLSGSVNVSDAIAILRFLFGGESELCSAAGDVNDSGALRISDAIQLISLLFLGESIEAPEPLGVCVARARADTSGCGASCR